MKGLTLFRRTTKSEGMIKLRFRLKDGREVDLYHKSETKADIKDLAKLEDAGELRPKVSIYNHELKEKIDREMSAIETAYIELCAKMDKKPHYRLHCLKKQSAGIFIPKIILP